MADKPFNTANLLIDATPDKCVDPSIITLSNMNFDGSGTITYSFDGSQLAFKPPTTGIRSLYFDARGLNADALITFSDGKIFRIPTGKQGFLPCYKVWPVAFKISSATGNGALLIELYNFKVAPIIW